MVGVAPIAMICTAPALSSNPIASFASCTASSRVGDTTSTRSPGSRLVRDGRRKARDLPEPVSAWRSTDSPAAMRGSAAAWIGVGVLMPRAASDAATAGGRLGRRSAKAGVVRAWGGPSAIAALPPQIHKTEPTHKSADARCGRTSSSIVTGLPSLKKRMGGQKFKVPRYIPKKHR